MAEFLKTILIIFLFLYLGVSLFLYLKQDSLVFAGAYHLKDEIEKKEYISKDTKEFSLTMEDGIKLYGSMSQNNSKNLLIYFGGNAENVTGFVDKLSSIKTVDTVSLNYRGYGKSRGKPSQISLYKDALEIYEHFKNRYEKIFILGRSLGTAVASYLASEKTNNGLILITPFDSISEVAKGRYPLLPIDLLINHPFNTIKSVKKTNSNISILMVKDDKVIPNIHTLKLKKKIPNLNLYEIIVNSDHNSIMDDYRLIEFIKKGLN